MIIFKFAWYLRGTNLILWTTKYTDNCLIWGLTKQKFWPLPPAYFNRLTNQIFVKNAEKQKSLTIQLVTEIMIVSDLSQLFACS